jgi:hemolysin D
MIRILLVDDQKSIRERLKSLLETEPDFDIVGMVDNGYDAIEQVKLLLPDVVLMDMEMPDIDGVLATKIISHSSLKTKVLVLSSHDSDEYVARSIYAGANGYILKGAPAQEICDAVRFVNRGYMQIAPGLFEKFIPNQADTGSLAWKSKGKKAQSLGQIEYPAGLELTGINNKKNQSIATNPANSEIDRPSELILDVTAMRQSRKSIGWYQAAALVLAGLGLTFSLYLLRQGLKKPANPPSHQDRSQQLHELPFTGKIVPVQITKIDATMPGSIVALHVKVGQSIQFGDRLLTIRNADAERANQVKIIQQEQVLAGQKQAVFQQVSQQRQQALQQQQQLIQQQQILVGEQQAATGRINSIKLAIANYQRNLAPLRQQVADANVQITASTTQPAQFALNQKRETITRAQALYNQTLATYERLAQYQSEGAISLERLEQAEKEMTVAKSDLNIAQADYDSAIAAAEIATNKQTAQAKSTQLQQQLALKEQAGQLQQLQSQLQVAQADRQQIGIRLQQLQRQKVLPFATKDFPISQKPLLEQTTIDITAPMAGIAIDLPIAIGDRVFAGNKLVGITNPSKLKIVLELEPRAATLLKAGQRAIVKVGSALESQELVGIIANIVPQVDRSTQHVEVEFTNPKPTMLVGQTGTVYFPKL